MLGHNCKDWFLVYSHRTLTVSIVRRFRVAFRSGKAAYWHPSQSERRRLFSARCLAHGPHKLKANGVTGGPALWTLRPQKIQTSESRLTAQQIRVAAEAYVLSPRKTPTESRSAVTETTKKTSGLFENFRIVPPNRNSICRGGRNECLPTRSLRSSQRIISFVGAESAKTNWVEAAWILTTQDVFTNPSAAIWRIQCRIEILFASHPAF